jgi:hypothetical protein
MNKISINSLVNCVVQMICRLVQILTIGPLLIIFGILLFIFSVFHFTILCAVLNASVVPLIVEYIISGNCFHTKKIINMAIDLDIMIYNLFLPTNKMYKRRNLI